MSLTTSINVWPNTGKDGHSIPPPPDESEHGNNYCKPFIV